MDTMELRSGNTLGETEMIRDSEEHFEDEVPVALEGCAKGDNGEKA